MKRTCLIVLAAALIFSGCAGSRVPPWLYGQSSQFPQQAFITGVGSASERDLAEDRARLEIAKVFSVDLQSREVSSEASQVTGGREEYHQEARSELVSRSGRILAGVTIAEVWRDSKARTWHALAVLDRVRLARSLAEELDGLDRRLDEQLRQAEAAVTPVRSLAAYLRAREVAGLRRSVAADLSVIRGGGAVDSAALSLGEIEARIERLAAGLRIALALDDDRGDIVASGVVGAFAAIGMRLAPEAESDVLLRGRVELALAPASAGVQWQVASAQMDLVERGGAVLDSVRLTVREGSQDAARAEVLARELLGRRLGQALLAKLRGLAAAPH